MGVTRAAGRRRLLTLEALGYLERRDRDYALTPRVLGLALAFLSSTAVVPLARQAMERLVAEFEKTCSLVLLDGTEVVFVERVEATTRLSAVNARVGTRIPALNTASGRAIAAWMDPEEQDRLIEAGFDPMTEAATRDPDALRAALTRVRRDGFAVIDGEMESGLRSVAAAIPAGPGGPRAAVAMLVRTDRHDLDALYGRVGPAIVTAIDLAFAGRPA